ncbi:uncharacterized protein PHALS_14780 [Plasmopara halstedii]|uniref:Uncharacterized protein n=1 Tax=Plasmopara halstedii TaxID=4781 RepID=A0A0P1ATX1_PLAHL|nr:uncharacterized protein PHALS_14780 [Plasmopara halstedii]CEG44154.1 hypothetical protein PHALS_14780 [Plasmopara halstedii]|eukprot:XP_024580523.1 hypothetical protein PHALS_14780 [Plasmopara halstedii]
MSNGLSSVAAKRIVEGGSFDCRLHDQSAAQHFTTQHHTVYFQSSKCLDNTCVRCVRVWKMFIANWYFCIFLRYANITC